MRWIVNRREVEREVDMRTSLLDLLREHLHLFGAKKGGNQGACGACTVLVDDERINSCLALAVQYQGREITTIEGLGAPGALHPLQLAFVEHDGFQCGYCTPGQICSAVGMAAELRKGVPSYVTADLEADPIALSHDELRERMSGNLCRCGAYNGIVDAIHETFGDLAAPVPKREPPDESISIRARLRRERGCDGPGTRRRPLSRRRHQSHRSHARNYRASRCAGGRDRALPRYRGDQRRGLEDRRRREEHRRRCRPTCARAVSLARPGNPCWRLRSDPQHGDGRRQSHAAHPMHLFLRRCRELQQT